MSSAIRASKPHHLRCSSLARSAKPHRGITNFFVTLKSGLQTITFCRRLESCLLGRTVLEEAATPEFPRFAKALPGNPHDSSPSGTIAYRQPCRDRGRLKTSHACTDGTLLQLSFDRNKKVRFDCAETVDVADCLWKVSEKQEIILLAFALLYTAELSPACCKS